MWPIPNFSTASRRVRGYFGDEGRVLGSILGTEDPEPAIALPKPDVASAVSESNPFSLGPSLSFSQLSTPIPLSVGPPLSSSSLPTLPQPRMTVLHFMFRRSRPLMYFLL